VRPATQWNCCGWLDWTAIRLADSGEVVDSLSVVTVAGAASVTDRVKRVVGMSESTGSGAFTSRFLAALAQHRHWGREQSERIPA
jgi:hypothetical protein